MAIRETIEHDPDTLALSALAWTLQDEARADRLLALTGLDAGALRERLDDPALLAGTLAFLEANEPDLIACADALGCTPVALLDAKRKLEA